MSEPHDENEEPMRPADEEPAMDDARADDDAEPVVDVEPEGAGGHTYGE